MEDVKLTKFERRVITQFKSIYDPLTQSEEKVDKKRGKK